MAIELSGEDSVLDAIEKFLDTSGVADGVGLACALVERKAKENCPSKTGELRRSITSNVEVGSAEIVGTVSTNLEYAPYIEFGTGLFAESGGRQDVPWNYKDDEGVWHSTSGQPPQPFMRPAINDSREEVARIIKEGFVQ